MPYIIHQDPQRVILCAVSLNGHYNKTEKSLEELERLAVTAGLNVVDKIIQGRERSHPVHYMGAGKIRFLKNLADEQGAEIIIFDDELTPSQQKNIRKIIKDADIIDRSALILKIFTDHAKTREAKTQVSLAEAEYLLPRLTRQWTHLERQAGGIGMRGGPGETQIEIDRRLLRDRIKKLKSELVKISTQMETKRKSRERRFNVSLVGYTNAGKSTIMNALSSANVDVEDQLFKTLDTTVRRVYLDKTHTIYLSDTVGFIQKLPHQLVASFRSTLKEAESADLLLKIIDISDDDFKHHISVIDDVLKDFDIPEKRFITVFNKTDTLKDPERIKYVKRNYPDAFCISAKRLIGVQSLAVEIMRRMDNSAETHIFYIPPNEGKIISDLHHFGNVLESKVDNDMLRMKVFMDRTIYQSLNKKYGLDNL